MLLFFMKKLLSETLPFRSSTDTQTIQTFTWYLVIHFYVFIRYFFSRILPDYNGQRRKPAAELQENRNLYIF